MTDPQLEARLRRGEARFKEIEAQLAKIVEATAPLPTIAADVAATREIVVAWNTAKNLGRFLKWFGPIAAAAAAVFLWAKAWLLFFKD